MTASEFAFLALGLVLGVLSGAALVEVLRSRPPAPREVRLTVTPDSVPRRRSTTLAEDAFADTGAQPATGGPGDRGPAEAVPAGGTTSEPPAEVAARAAPARTDVRSGRGSSTPQEAAVVAVPVYREADPTLEALRSQAAATAERAIREQRLTAAAVLERPSPHAAGGADRSPEVRPTAAGEGAPGAAPSAEAATAKAPGAAPSDALADDAPCAEVRRVADERCNVAAIARSQADAAHDALRAAQRSYDEHLGRVEAASGAADPRAIRTAKETAQQRFRAARAVAATPEAVEAAARDWLTEINRINQASREAATAIQRERAAANTLVASIERLTVEADAARIAAESAAEACVAAREAVAECQEATTLAESAAKSGWPATPSVGQGGGRPGPWEEESELEAAFSATGEGEPAILRLLRGERATLGRIVSQLAGDDAREKRRWQLALAGLVDAIVARSIEASALTFPVDHGFWGAFTLAQNRDIVAALSSLGYRFDGLGGWTDGRVPTQRDLSLAIGYAGLDPVRIRQWPTEAELEALFADVAVAADEYLAEAAGGLTLGELVSLLGRRADGLADLWNEWGRVRPLLLSGG